MNAKKVKMTMEEYHAHTAVGSSGLRTLIDQSPAHYLWNKTHPSEPTPAQRRGTIIHTAILEPKIFLANSIVCPEFSGKGMREAKDNWLTENHGKIILSREDMEMVRGILDSISADPDASNLVSAGHAEESIFWTDDDTGVECKARLDFPRENHIVVDVKTTADAGYNSFKKDIANYGYHIQGAFYLEAATQAYGARFDEFMILAVEKEPPYAVSCFRLDDSAINEGRALYKTALKLLKRCISEGKFPAYGGGIRHIDLPSWGYKGEV